MCLHMHIEILELLKNNNFKIPKVCAIYAFNYDKIKILKWLKHNMNLKFYYDENKKYNSSALTIQWLKNNADNMDNVVIF
jgi:hypothetical protein